MLKALHRDNNYFLDKLIYFLPISMILGNAAININCLIIILVFFTDIIKKNNFEFIKKPKTNFIIFLITLFFIINVYFSVHVKISLISYLGVIKYMLLASAIMYCSKNIGFFIDKFSKLILIVLILVSLDVLIQFFIGVDLFGNELKTNHGVRLSGPFGDEYIVGSYIGKFVLLSMFYFNRDNKFYSIFYLLFILSIVFLSNERSASIMCLAAITVYFILTPHFKFKTKLINLSALFIVIAILFNINTQLKDHFIKRSFEQFGITFNKKGGYEHRSFWDSRWGAHYLTAIEINKNNPFLGSGLHTYRIECLDKKYEKINSTRFSERCNTHPHNIYLEIWSELGTLFFIFIIIFHIYFSYRLIKIYFFDKILQQEASILISLYFMLFFPFQTTGSLFSTWNGVIYWITIALCLNLFNKSTKNLLNKKNLNKPIF